MKRRIDAVELGGTLFVPATHKHLHAIACGEKLPALRAAVFDTEDGIREEELEAGIDRIAAMLPGLGDNGPFRFIRPRTPDVLARFVRLDGIEKVDGFVLPKFGLDNAGAYLDIIGEHLFMPAVEGEELFDVTKLRQLRDILLPFREQIIVMRFGAEDMLRQLGLRRDCSRMLYDMCAPSQVVANMLNTFKPHGFEVSASVFRCYDDHAGFEAEVKRDLAEGLVGKTIIHPNQIEPIERLYRVSERELKEAEMLLASDKAVFAQDGAMAECTTQRNWAEHIRGRAHCYGIDV